MFRFLNRLESTRTVETVAGSTRDPFDAVPMHHPLAEARLDSRNCRQICMQVTPGKGLGRRLADRMGWHRHVRVDLDEHGSHYWSLVDGKRSLQDIELQLRTRFDLERDESRKAVLLFTKSLMMRNLLLLDLGKEQGSEAEESPEKEDSDGG